MVLGLKVFFFVDLFFDSLIEFQMKVFDFVISSQDTLVLMFILDLVFYKMFLQIIKKSCVYFPFSLT